jgi:hypothetical protein
MNNEMAYLLGMVCGNGTVRRGNNNTTVSIDIPHKKLVTEDIHDIALYVQASLETIRNIIQPLIGVDLSSTPSKAHTTLSFTKPNGDFLIRTINKSIGNATSHDNVRINGAIFELSKDERIMFLRGFADVTGYIRRANYYYDKHKHRVYIEIPHNWELVIDICNLLKSVGIPVQTIRFAHPNFVDGNLEYYNAGKINAWKKEHQIKIWANEFLPIGFTLLHKKQLLENLAKELLTLTDEKETHRFYWQTREIKNNRSKPNHPCVIDTAIPTQIRGKQFSSWKDVAKELGYSENS